MSNGDNEDFNVIATRTAVWHASALEIPNEREVVKWPVEGDDAARAVRLGEIYGNIMAAIGHGERDVSDELARLIAAATVWMEALVQR